MRKLSQILLLALLLLSSCTAYKKVPYLVDADTLTTDTLAKASGFPEVIIRPGDLVMIRVVTSDMTASMPFNMQGSPFSAAGFNSNFNQQTMTSNSDLVTYLVDNQGNIDYPILGAINIGGLTKPALQQLIKSKIYPHYITEEPVIIVRLKNFNVTVTGAVKSPRIVTSENERLTIFEALTQAGDLALTGKRKNVMIIRTDDDGIRNVIRVDLQDKNLLLSDNFYLQQNDLVYVEPNRSEGNRSWSIQSEFWWTGIISSLLGITSVLISLMR